MAAPMVSDLAEAAKAIEAITGVPARLQMKKSRQERLEAKERVKRFLALPPQLQEGVLRYGQGLRETYSR